MEPVTIPVFDRIWKRVRQGSLSLKILAGKGKLSQKKMAQSSTFDKLSTAKIEEIIGSATDATPGNYKGQKMSQLTRLLRV